MFNACNYHITIAEVGGSSRDLEAIFTTSEYNALIDYLATYPEAGAIMPGTGGIRKLRWAAKGQGKRGGARVIYYFRDLNMPVYILAVYAKGERIDLTEDDKSLMRKLVDEIVYERIRVRVRLISGGAA